MFIYVKMHVCWRQASEDCRNGNRTRVLSGERHSLGEGAGGNQKGQLKLAGNMLQELLQLCKPVEIFFKRENKISKTNWLPHKWPAYILAMEQNDWWALPDVFGTAEVQNHLMSILRGDWLSKQGNSSEES